MARIRRIAAVSEPVRKSKASTTTYVRFVVGKLDEHSNSRQGVFQAAFSLRDAGKLEPHEEEWFEREMAWLRMHLQAPPCLRRPDNDRAICWFHPRAVKAIEKARSIAALLNEKGLLVRMVKTRDPGVVVYEDGLQVAAKPRRRARQRGSKL